MTQETSAAVLESPFSVIWRWLSRRPFLKNVAIMLGGSVGGQMVSLMLAPVLTRLYTPEQFGILSVYSAILSIVVVIASLRYELALPLARDDEDAINLMAVCLLVLAATTIGVGIVSWLFPERWLERVWPQPLNSSHIAIYRALLVLGYFCLGGYFVALYVATRANAFRSIAKTRFSQGVVGPASQIGLALVGGGAPALLVGSIVGQSAGTLGLFYGVLAPQRDLLRKISWSRMVEQAKRYRRFPIVGSWSALIDAAGGSQLLYLLVSLTYSARIAGFIFLAERIASRPLAIIGTSILQVFVGEAGRTVKEDPAQLKKRFYQLISRQFLLATAWLLLVNVAAGLTFSKVFGAEWGEATIYLRAMSIGYLTQAMTQPVFHTLQLLEKQGLAAAWEALRLALSIGAFFLCSALGWTPAGVIAFYSGAQALSGIVLLLLMAAAIEKQQRVIE